jgi:hypothetical protein
VVGVPVLLFPITAMSPICELEADGDLGDS